MVPVLFAFCLFASSLPPDLYQALKRMHIPPTNSLVVVDASTQTLTLFKQGKQSFKYIISTAKNGVGQIFGSEQTPLGLHIVAEKYGRNAEPYTIFRSRKNMGEIWCPKKKYAQEDLVLTRILYLEGLEEGLNRGKNSDGLVVDSYQRYIYIHATNHEEDLGKPASKGCVRMSTSDIIELFDEVPQGSLVWISK